MERVGRKPLQGVGNIVRFNWHFYLSAVIAVFIAASILQTLSGVLYSILSSLLIIIVLAMVVSLVASAYIYDISSLYSLHWLHIPRELVQAGIVNIHAGFDESSESLRRKFSKAPFAVFDFYHPEYHTEVSLKRARKAYPAFPDTQRITTDNVPVPEHSVGVFLLLFAAHEIRKDDERIIFFRQLQSALHPEGQIIVVEHLRDWKNFLVYTVGFFHFHSRKTWEHTFSKAHLAIVSETKITPFVTVFTLCGHGTSPYYHRPNSVAVSSGTSSVS